MIITIHTLADLFLFIIDREFWNLLKCRPESPNTSCICDIYDGLMYAEHSNCSGFLDKRANPANVSFVLNTDGVSLFKSSCKDIWPIFLVINELQWRV